MQLYDKYKKDKTSYEQAKSYLSLLDARDQAGGRFSYSHAHSTIKLMICGQHRAGDKNYHDSDESLNKAILQAINARELIALGVERLRLQMVQSLKDCQSEIDAVKADLESVAEPLAT
jgi:hypothetical protein